MTQKDRLLPSGDGSELTIDIESAHRLRDLANRAAFEQSFGATGDLIDYVRRLVPPKQPHRLQPRTDTGSYCTVCGDRDSGQRGISQSECPGVRERCQKCGTRSDIRFCPSCQAWMNANQTVESESSL